MNFTKEQLTEKTQAGLVEIAVDLGLELDPSEDKDLLIGAIQDAQGKKAKLTTRKRTTTRKAEEPKASDPEERVSVIFHETSGPDGDAAVKLSLNGEAVVAKRGEVVNIKRKFLKGVVDNAVITEFVRDEKSGEIKTRNVPRFPYSFA
jgi:hypothetical protein